MYDDFIPDIYNKEILVLGCGNILFGDDGFGPAVVEYFSENYNLPSTVCLINAGTGARDILFNILLSEKKPEKIIIVDSIDKGKQHGEVFEVSLDDIPSSKTDDFSMHLVPSSNLLKELNNFCKVEVIVISAQPENIPESVQPGLSESLANSIPYACELIIEKINKYA